jgi:heat shock protein HtpX
MTAAARLACPACGAGNAPAARLCRMCRAALAPDAAPLFQTDFAAAERDNERRTALLVLGLMLLLWSFGYVLGWAAEAFWRQPELSAGKGEYEWIWFFSVWGLYGAAAAVLAGTAAVLVALIQTDALLLDLLGGRLLSPGEERRFENVAEEMAIAAGMSKPRLAVIETPALNAFAYGTGPDNAVIGVTRGLLDTLSRDELQAVVAHEMAHLVNHDVRHATLAGVFAGTIAFVGEMLARGFSRVHVAGSRRGGNGGLALLALIVAAFAVLAPVIARLLQMAVSRQREFMADATGVRLTRSPLSLISALNKLESGPPLRVGASTQHLFILNPLLHYDDLASALLSTHPPTQRRIQRLRNLGG